MLLLFAVALTVSGWALYNDAGGDWLEEVHELLANLMLAVVGVHIAGVVISSWLHRENLVASMLSGRKFASPQEAIRSAWHSIAAVMLVFVLGFWWVQWRDAPNPEQTAQLPARTERAVDQARGEK